MIFSHRRSSESMRRFYNWFSRFYPAIERSIAPIHDEVMARILRVLGVSKDKTAIEYACGSGSLSLLLADHYRSVEGRDASAGMLHRARQRALDGGKSIRFAEGDMTRIVEPDGSFDDVFVSFALHLFAPPKVEEILAKLLAVCRNRVIIIDHPRTWTFTTAFVEWIEGSYYGPFISMDFRALAGRLSATVVDLSFGEGCDDAPSAETGPRKKTPGAAVLIFSRAG